MRHSAKAALSRAAINTTSAKALQDELGFVEQLFAIITAGCRCGPAPLIPGTSRELSWRTQKYIKRWQADDRMSTAIRHALATGYNKQISAELLDQGLPPQFSTWRCRKAYLMNMPARERNFWRLLAKYKDRVPAETYDYVFYIVSAAVIGEDPRVCVRF